MALTNEQKEQKMRELRVFIAEHKDSKGPLMPIMQKAQELSAIFLSRLKALLPTRSVSPCPEVYGVATFYAQFSLEPKGENVISICTGTACYVKGAQAVVDEAERSLEFPAERRARTANSPFRVRDVSGAAVLHRLWL